MKIQSFRLLAALIFFLVGLSGIPSHSFAAQKKYRGLNFSSGLQAQDLQDLANLIHPNSIRYTLIYGSADTATKEEYFSWLTQTLDKFDATILPIVAQSNMKVILSLGTPFGGFSDRVSAHPQMRLFVEKDAQDGLLEVWDLLARRYVNNTSIVAFHLLNEPAVGASRGSGLLNWSQLQSKLVTNIRAIDNKHAIIVSAEYSGPNRIQKVTVPKGTKGPIWYGLTMYYPTAFLRQGVENAPYTTTYPKPRGDKKTILKYLDNAIQFGKTHKAQIWVSEFTTTRFGPKNSGPRYLKDVVSIFKANGWHWTYHAWREASPWDVEKPALEDADGAVTQRVKLLKSFTR